MSKIDEIVNEIEDMLYDGYTVDEVAIKLLVPLNFVEEVKKFIFQKANEEFIDDLY